MRASILGNSVMALQHRLSPAAVCQGRLLALGKLSLLFACPESSCFSPRLYILVGVLTSRTPLQCSLPLRGPCQIRIPLLHSEAGAQWVHWPAACLLPGANEPSGSVLWLIGCTCHWQPATEEGEEYSLPQGLTPGF